MWLSVALNMMHSPKLREVLLVDRLRCREACDIRLPGDTGIYDNDNETAEPILYLKLRQSEVLVS